MNSSGTCLFVSPVGSWQRRLHSDAVEFGGHGEETLPPHLTLKREGTSLVIPAYAVAVYVAQD
jgi:hypothetical protein